MIKKQYVLVFGGLAIVIVVPPMVYFWQFHDFNFAQDPGGWGVLGDYIGGTLNPIISLLSLVVLAYLTYMVAQQGNIESKRLFIFEKQLAAYEDLTKYFKETNMVPANYNKAFAPMKIVAGFPIEKQLEVATAVSDGNKPNHTHLY